MQEQLSIISLEGGSLQHPMFLRRDRPLIGCAGGDSEHKKESREYVNEPREVSPTSGNRTSPGTVLLLKKLNVHPLRLQLKNPEI
ncbi:hypothetical protein TNCV_2617951 [Trichonephila clavipes]|nr:hypothetical protein TNCV_2617951 [Trichonephila clavipes]